MMKITQNSKEYQYDYKILYVTPEVHKKLKTTSINESMKMGAVVEMALDFWKKHS